MPVCEVCSREVGEMTTHHLVPRTRHKHKKAKKYFVRERVKSRPVELCRTCHKRVHELRHKDAAPYF